MKYVLILTTIFTSFSVLAQPEPQSQFGKDILHVWGVSAKNAIDIAEKMPEAYYDFKPTDSSKTFGDQIGHIAFTVRYLTDGFINNQWGEYKDPDTKEMTKEEVLQMLRTDLEYGTNAIASMTDEQATETIKAFGGRMLKRYVTVLFIQDHLTNHKAKANLYLRMKGIKPPPYAYFN